MRDMMNYHCLRVFRSRVKRIGKHSSGFSMFLFVWFLIINCLLTNSMVLHLGDHALLINDWMEMLDEKANGCCLSGYAKSIL